MQVKFDSLDRFETPDFYLCNPGSEYTDGKLTRVVGPIVNTSEEEVILNFSATSELNFRVCKPKLDNSDISKFVNKIYKDIQNRRLVFVDDIGYFVITDVQEKYENGMYTKDIKASSCETEIQNKSLTFIEDNTYEFTDLLEKVVSSLPKWKIAENGIASTLKNKYRTFEDVDINLNTLAFLQSNMQDAYECIFVFDIINRQIYAYDQNDYAKLTDIHLTKDDLINSIEISENSNDLYTALRIYGGDSLTISGVNPLGGNVIYNFDYYLDWMSEPLRSKVELWSSKTNDCFEEYYDLNDTYYSLLSDKTGAEAEIARLQTRIDLYTKCRENIVAAGNTDGVSDYNASISENGGNEIDISGTITDTIAAINALINSDTALKLEQQERLGDIESGLIDAGAQIIEIQNSLSLQNTENFSEYEYAELSDYIYEGIYTDEYVIITEDMSQSERLEQMRTLYDRAKKQLVLISHPTQEFSVDVEDFIFEKRFIEWSYQLEAGCLINIELDINDIAALFLSSIQLNWHDHSLLLTFGNRFNRFDPKALFDDVLGNIQKSANSVEYIKNILYPIKHGRLDEFQESIDSSRILAMNAAIAAANQSVTIDASGYTGRKINETGNADPRQIKITNNAIVFTDDAWNSSCSTALGEFEYNGEQCYGINAQTVIGEALIGGSLNILAPDGTPILQAIEGKIKASLEGSESDGSEDNSIIQRLCNLEATASKWDLFFDKKEVVANKVTTSGKQYTFDDTGLRISASVDGASTSIVNKIDETGMNVSRGEETVLKATDAGVEAIDITVNNFLRIGGANEENYSRFEKYVNEHGSTRTACFWV